MKWHNHHIVPKHMGGTDNPSNIVRVNVPMHAFLHKCLYEEYGDKYDYISWKTLSGQMTMSEASKMAEKEGSRRGGHRTAKLGKSYLQNMTFEQRSINSKKMIKNHPNLHVLGGKASVASQFARGTHINQLGKSAWQTGAAGKASAASPNHINKRKFRCVEHGTVGRLGPMKRHHKYCQLIEIKLS